MRGGHVTNLLSFGIGWFACVVGAANGTPSYGIAVAAMLLALNILVAEDPIHEARVIATVGAIGFVLDTMLALYGWHGRHHTAHVTSLRQRMGWGD